MNDPNRDLGEALAHALGEGPSRRALAAQRATLLLRWSAQQAWPRRRPWVPLALGTVALCAALVFTFWRSSTAVAPMTWEGAPVADHQTLHAEDGPGRLEFANGSHIELRAASSAVVGRRANRVEVALQTGRLEADVQRTAGTDWIVAAGPYRVRVIGTRFSVAWQPDAKSFAVEVTRGEVRVSGGNLPSEGIAVRAGARLERSGGDEATPDEQAARTSGEEARNAERSPAAATSEELSVETPPAEPSSAEPSSVEGAPVEGAPVEGAPAARVHSGPRSNDAPWRKLSAEGRYEEALAAVSPGELERLLTVAPAADLLQLGNTARFAGQPGRARRAYTALRDRFQQAPEARLAAFSLARLSADVDRQPEQAVRWLRVFLSESPSGDLAASARARLMDTLAGQGKRTEAAEVARDYLRYHPGGPHAGVARSLLDSSSRR